MLFHPCPQFPTGFTYVLLGTTEAWDAVDYPALLAVLNFVLGVDQDLPQSSVGLGWGLNAMLLHGTLDAFRHTFDVW